MPELRMIVGVLILGLLLGNWNLSAEENSPGTPSKEPSAPTARPKKDLPELPAIPWPVITQLNNAAAAERFGFTKKQRDDLTALIMAHFKKLRGVQISHELQMSQLTNHWLQQAANDLTAETEAESQAQALKLLSNEQQALIRQAHRQQIQQWSLASQRKAVPPARAFGPPLDTQLANNDLLSILELPDVQQALAITDEQWQQIELIKHDAEPAARTLILQLATGASVPAFANVPNLETLLTPFGEETMNLLTRTQHERYLKIIEVRQKKLAETLAKVPPPVGFIPFWTHGSVKQLQIQSKGDDVTATVALYNAFEDSEIKREIDLSPSQQTEIATRLEEFRANVQKHFIEQQRNQNTAQTARKEKLRELIQAHNAVFQKRLEPLLTADQKAQLKKECWKSLGWAALLKPEMAEQLELTTEQTAAIQKALNTPAPNIIAAPANESFDDFKKRSDEFHRKALEHHRAIAKGVWDELNPDQRRQFEKLTGMKPPAAIE